jgi:hypothetical protein
MPNVTFYENVFKKSGLPVDLISILKAIKSGKWKDQVQAYRDDPTEELKKKNPALTVSGVFEERRRAKELTDHSGYIAMDFDDIENVDQAFEILSKDPYTTAVFRSISGNGLCAIIRITPSKHDRAFEGLERYYLSEYEMGIDPACKDVSRLRFISYDPDMYYNGSADLFKEYVKKKKGRKPKIPAYFTDENDFQFVLDQITAQKIDLTAEYSDWVKLAFAIYDEYGESGEQYFHAISQFHPDYSERQTRAKYKSARNGSNVSISSFFYLAKQAGLEITSPESRQIVRQAKYARKGNRPKEQVSTQLEEVDNISPERSENLIDQIFDAQEVEDPDDDDTLGQIIEYLRTQRDLIYNEVDMKYYDSGHYVNDRGLNSIYLDVKTTIKKANKNLTETVIFSNRIDSINPIKDFFTSNKVKKTGAIQALADAIKSPTGMDGENFMPEYVHYFLKKWLVGAIAMWHGKHSPLMLVLVGEQQNTGKTHFFRYLLPDEMQKYYGEIQMDGSKDDSIMMCTKAMLLNDEMSMRKRADLETIKKLCSAQWFNVRKPYGKMAEDLRRIAVLAGTSNNTEIIDDPTGNRRIIPIEIDNIPHDAYNNIDKKDLWMEAYAEFTDGYQYILGDTDIEMLNKNTSKYEESSLERELLQKYCKEPQTNPERDLNYHSNSEVKVYLEMQTNQRLGTRKLGMELKSLGYNQEMKTVNGKYKRAYFIELKK